jgi:hypothetical protein
LGGLCSTLASHLCFNNALPLTFYPKT